MREKIWLNDLGKSLSEVENRKQDNVNGITKCIEDRSYSPDCVLSQQ